MAVIHTATNLSQALHGALDKMARMIESTLGRAEHSSAEQSIMQPE